ncbi:hypothetical protein JIR23_14205 [Bradyrhizobium diazoefficiens]|nr:hypothetical protein [Bradyrhizobium diazoefficiens]QQN66748.1 hypothetical protein JIR23_14205 [Bradyrhizobium diazoefficiens]
MTSQLKPDEQFVIRALAEHLSATWSVGEDPPDSYLTIGAEKVAVEISTLTQHVVSERGGMKPRLSEDSTAFWLADELNGDLLNAIPDERMVILTLRAPILKARQTKEKLKNRITRLLASSMDQTIDVEEDILGNPIGIQLSAYDGHDPRKVHAAVINRKSDPRITLNARLVLEERIVTKTGKCDVLASNGPVWLALFNDYFLADDETYKLALTQIEHPHVFEKIFLISGRATVTTLYARAV